MTGVENKKSANASAGSDEQRQEERYTLAQEMASSGKAAKDIVNSLSQKGLNKEQAAAIAENTTLLQTQAEYRKAIDNMSIGAFSIFMGILITVIGATGVGTDFRFLILLGGFGLYKGGLGLRDFLELKKQVVTR